MLHDKIPVAESPRQKDPVVEKASGPLLLFGKPIAGHPGLEGTAGGLEIDIWLTQQLRLPTQVCMFPLSGDMLQEFVCIVPEGSRRRIGTVSHLRCSITCRSGRISVCSTIKDPVAEKDVSPFAFACCCGAVCDRQSNCRSAMVRENERGTEMEVCRVRK
jgi:hypothetical protein